MYAAVLDERHVFSPHRLACPSTAHAFGPCPAISASTLHGRTCVYLETAHMLSLRDRIAKLMRKRVLRSESPSLLHLLAIIAELTLRRHPTHV